MNDTCYSWDNVFNTKHRFYGHVSLAYAACKNAGYRYMSWNGWVYDTEAPLFNDSAKVCEESELK